MAALSSVRGSKPYCSSRKRVQPSSLVAAQDLYRPTRGAASGITPLGTPATAVQVTPGSALLAAARAAAVSMKTVPAGQARSPVTGSRAIQALPARTAADTTLAGSGPLGLSAKAAPSTGGEAGTGAYAVSRSGRVPRSTVTPIMRGSDHAATS